MPTIWYKGTTLPRSLHEEFGMAFLLTAILTLAHLFGGFVWNGNQGTLPGTHADAALPGDNHGSFPGK